MLEQNGEQIFIVLHFVCVMLFNNEIFMIYENWHFHATFTNLLEFIINI